MLSEEGEGCMGSSSTRGERRWSWLGGKVAVEVEAEVKSVVRCQSGSQSASRTTKRFWNSGMRRDARGGEQKMEEIAPGEDERETDV